MATYSWLSSEIFYTQYDALKEFKFLIFLVFKRVLLLLSEEINIFRLLLFLRKLFLHYYSHKSTYYKHAHLFKSDDQIWLSC